MKDIALSPNRSNGRMGMKWDELGQDVVFDESEQHAVMASLVAVRAKWWADTQGVFGSQLTKVKNILRSTTSSQVEAYAREALAALVKAGRITIVRVLVELPKQGLSSRISLAVYWTSRGGPEQNERVFI